MHAVADEFLKCRGYLPFRRTIDKKTDCLIQEIVAGRAMHRPVVSKRLPTGQDFLEDEINGASVSGRFSPQRFGAFPLKFLEILVRQIKAVRMIDAQAGDGARVNELQ